MWKIIDFGGEASTLWSRNQKNPGFGRKSVVIIIAFLFYYKNSQKIITKRFEKFKKDDYKKNQKIAPKNDLKNNLKMSGF